MLLFIILVSLQNLVCILHLEDVAHAAVLDGRALEEKERQKAEKGKGRERMGVGAGNRRRKTLAR